MASNVDERLINDNEEQFILKKDQSFDKLIYIRLKNNFCRLILICLVIVIIGLFIQEILNIKRMYNCSEKGAYNKMVVVADSPTCSMMGCEILQKNGNFIDAAVVTVLCTGLFNKHSTGIGGGGFAVVFHKGRANISYDFRETVPNYTSVNYNRTLINLGALSIGIPGKVRGLYEIWKKHGKLRWEFLIQNIIDLNKRGIEVNKPLSVAINSLTFSEALELKLNKDEHSVFELGDIIKDFQLTKFFEVLKTDPMSFYNGSVSRNISMEICDIIKLVNKTECYKIWNDDLMNYKVIEKPLLQIPIFKNHTFLIMISPSGSISLAMILLILEKCKSHFGKDIYEINQAHIFVEAMKHSYAWQFRTGDPFGAQNISYINNFEKALKDNYAEFICSNKILLNQTFNVDYYDETYDDGVSRDSTGTSHVSIVDADGNAISITTSINRWFGSKIRSPNYGFIYNNHNADFFLRNEVMNNSKFVNNFIEAGRKPLSFMSPIIAIDKNNDVQLVIGASGGTRIVSTLAKFIHDIYNNIPLVQVADSPRLHHQLIPNVVNFEDKYPIDKITMDFLESKGHKVMSSSLFSSVQAIFRDKQLLNASTDPRKPSITFGY